MSLLALVAFASFVGQGQAVASAAVCVSSTIGMFQTASFFCYSPTRKTNKKTSPPRKSKPSNSSSKTNSHERRTLPTTRRQPQGRRGHPSREKETRPKHYPAMARCKAVREKLGLSQTQFASLIGISPRTLQNWEQGHRRPEGTACALLRIAESHP